MQQGIGQMTLTLRSNIAGGNQKDYVNPQIDPASGILP
jgi:hypothetical protein